MHIKQYQLYLFVVVSENITHALIENYFNISVRLKKVYLAIVFFILLSMNKHRYSWLAHYDILLR